jgi:nucleotide-binding universal stress UspA family protein
MLNDTKHILVPLDFTDRNDQVLASAHDIAEKTGARVTLIHVVEPMADSDDETLQAFTTRLTEEAEQHLQKRADKLADLGSSVACENRVGKRHSEIVSFAMENDVDLIIMNSHRVTAATEPQNAFSLSHQIALMAPCAILMLKS